MLTVKAPAKINLSLRILSRRPDGYHNLRSFMQKLDLCDVVQVTRTDRLGISCLCRGRDIPGQGKNIALLAAEKFQQANNMAGGIAIGLEKNIPVASGLGGGSSDAASTLLALNKLWELKLPVSELVHLAAKLGSDVPFFIYGGTALVEGKGEKVTPLPSLPLTWFVLLVPPLAKIQDKAKQLYSRLDASHFTKGQFVQAALPSLRQGKTLAPILMFNVFEKVAFDFLPNLAKYKKSFEEAGAASIYLVGSGPCLFTFVSEEGKANELCLRLRKQGLECYVASSFPG